MELQKLVKNIFGSEESRKQFVADPAGTLRSYNLSEEERKAVMEVHSTLGIVTSDSPQMVAAIKASYDWYSGAPGQ